MPLFASCSHALPSSKSLIEYEVAISFASTSAVVEFEFVSQKVLRLSHHC